MIKAAYLNGVQAAFDRFGLPGQPAPITETMVQSPTMNALPAFGKALRSRSTNLGATLGLR